MTMPWPRRDDCIGPDSLAIWNRLSVLQVETAIEAAAAEFTLAEIAELVAADEADVRGCLERHGLGRMIH